MSGNETEWTGFELFLHYCSLDFALKTWLWCHYKVKVKKKEKKVTGTFEKEALGAWSSLGKAPHCGPYKENSKQFYAGAK